jgi:hypothetical protein
MKIQECTPAMAVVGGGMAAKGKSERMGYMDSTDGRT